MSNEKIEPCEILLGRKEYIMIHHSVFGSASRSIEQILPVYNVGIFIRLCSISIKQCLEVLDGPKCRARLKPGLYKKSNELLCDPTRATLDGTRSSHYVVCTTCSNLQWLLIYPYTSSHASRRQNGMRKTRKAGTLV